MSSLRALIGGGRILEYVLPMMAGREVLAVQRSLRALRLLADEHVSGLFGPETRAALRRFQSEHKLTVDGLFGPQTLTALSDALGEADAGAPVNVEVDGVAAGAGPPVIVDPAWLPPARAERVIIHWTAGGHVASNEDRQHYHFLIEVDGTIRHGTFTIADNDSTDDGRYAAHTLHANTRAVGITVCGMMRATERPFSPGPRPFNELQWRTMARLAAQICHRYAIPVTDRTVLAHGEVQKNLGIRQRGKWDPLVLPWQTELSHDEVADQFRGLVSAALSGAEDDDIGRTLDLNLLGQTIANGAASHDARIWLKLPALTEAKGWSEIEFAENGATIAADGREIFVDAFRHRDRAGGGDTVYVDASDVAEQLDLVLDFDRRGTTAILTGTVGGAEQRIEDRAFVTVTVSRGDTLAGIARRRLGDHNRWPEILRPNGSRFNEQSARLLQPGDQVLVPKIDGAPQIRPAAALDAGALDAIAEGVARLTHPLNREAARKAVPLIIGACRESGVGDPAHIAYVLATAEHETNFGRAMVEEWGPSARQAGYETNPSNEKPGDGKLFRGRGYVQLTFRENYRKFSQALGIDLENDPDKAAEPEIAATVLAVGMSRVGYRRPSLVLSRFGSGDGFDFERARQIVNADQNRFEARYDTTIGRALGRKARQYFALF